MKYIDNRPIYLSEVLRNYDLMDRTALGRKLLEAVKAAIRAIPDVPAQKLAYVNIYPLPGMQRLIKQREKMLQRMEKELATFNETARQTLKAICTEEGLDYESYMQDDIVPRLTIPRQRIESKEWFRAKAVEPHPTRAEIGTKVQALLQAFGQKVDDFWVTLESESDKKTRLSNTEKFISETLPSMAEEFQQKLESFLSPKR